MFRGTYADGTSDWKRNLQVNLIQVPLPSALLHGDDSNSKDDKSWSNICFFHRGCYEYLFRNSDRGQNYPNERYEEIIQNLLAVLEQYPDYKVFISGHSLGGSLGQLVAFYASAEERIPKPVTCVSIGSLLVGDEQFQCAFERAESLGWIRHLRITNDNDPVPHLPPFSWYKPVGVHLQLNQDTGYSISHARGTCAHLLGGEEGWRFFWKLLLSVAKSTSLSISMDKIIEPHNIPEYLKRLEREKPFLKELELNALYRDQRIVGKDFRTML
jgi:pimeloyl-ACP methyl ester carboxylesterase